MLSFSRDELLVCGAVGTFLTGATCVLRGAPTGIFNAFARFTATTTVTATLFKLSQAGMESTLAMLGGNEPAGPAMPVLPQALPIAAIPARPAPTRPSC